MEQFEEDLKACCFQTVFLLNNDPELKEEKIDEHLCEIVLKSELENRGYSVESQRYIPVFWRGRMILKRRSDLICRRAEFGCILELKNVEKLGPPEQLLYYMKKLNCYLGYFVNFSLKRNYHPQIEVSIEPPTRLHPPPDPEEADLPPAPARGTRLHSISGFSSMRHCPHPLIDDQKTLI
ncbi:hypothetical protein PAPYR_6816 [Paratrimastix pyriformis]|uniref:GxxExxY protein n=1 Tax=Paratrimastix pyriformis TaxID=342808 RepID=A0ABQ8UEF9_9EUKA|nr:hypothetical protein PAPYR_6816 [Paratrimastix pyriformis]